jgi:hypothetical protein
VKRSDDQEWAVKVIRLHGMTLPKGLAVMIREFKNADEIQGQGLVPIHIANLVDNEIMLLMPRYPTTLAGIARIFEKDYKATLDGNGLVIYPDWWTSVMKTILSAVSTLHKLRISHKYVVSLASLVNVPSISLIIA